MSRKQVSYLTNERTMALVPVANERFGTRVYEEGTSFYIKERPIELIKAACLEGGSSYSGRVAAVKHQTGQRNKCPIPICPRRGIYAYPTHSSKSFHCSWLFVSHIKTIISRTSKANKETTIVFHDGQQIILGVSSYIIEQQMNRAARCFMVFSEGGQRRFEDRGYSYIFERHCKD